MSNIGALFSGQDSGIVQAAEVPLFSQKYNATDTAVILGKEYPPVPPPVFSRLASFYQAVKVLTSVLLPPGTHTPTTRTQHGQEKIPNIMIIIIIVFIIRLRYIFILFFVDTKWETSQHKESVYLCSKVLVVLFNCGVVLAVYHNMFVVFL